MSQEPIDISALDVYQEAMGTAITKVVNLVTLIEQLTSDCPLCGGYQLGSTGMRLKHRRDCPIIETLREVTELHEVMVIGCVNPSTLMEEPLSNTFVFQENMEQPVYVIRNNQHGL